LNPAIGHNPNKLYHFDCVVLSNHFHLVLRSRPDVVQTWDDSEVARRWLMLCPLRRDSGGQPAEPSASDLDTIRRNPQRLAEIRSRLSDISWWMRLLTQPLAARANKEENLSGRFWQGRFRGVRLCDESAILACAAYVDLNLIRAAVAQTLEQSRFTSASRRIESLRQSQGEQENENAGQPTAPQTTADQADRFLSPVMIDERRDDIGPVPSSTPYRASDKGFLPMTSAQYIQLLDWTARQVLPGKSATPSAAPPVLQRLGITARDWSQLVANFSRLYYLVAGRPTTLSNQKTRLSQRGFYVPRAASQLFASSG
jgi:hypothetical protein